MINLRHSSNKQSELKVKQSQTSREYFIETAIVENDELKSQLFLADILLVPFVTEFRDIQEALFPERAEEIYTFIRSRIQDEYSIDICVEGEDFQELALHEDLVYIGSFFLQFLAAPILVNVLSEFIKQRISNRPHKNPLINVKLHIENKGKTTEIEYEGYSEGFGEVIEVIKKLDDNHES